MAVITTPRRRGKGRVIFPRRNLRAAALRVQVGQPRDPIVESIGALADFPLWDEYLAILAQNRIDQDRRDAGGD